jgi:hypothetical protein
MLGARRGTAEIGAGGGGVDSYYESSTRIAGEFLTFEQDAHWGLIALSET